MSKCLGCKEKKPCYGCEHDRRAKVEGDKIQEIIEKVFDLLGQGSVSNKPYQAKKIYKLLEQELSKQNKDTEILDVLPCGCKQIKRWAICGDCYEKALKAMKEGKQ